MTVATLVKTYFAEKAVKKAAQKGEQAAGDLISHAIYVAAYQFFAIFLILSMTGTAALTLIVYVVGNAQETGRGFFLAALELIGVPVGPLGLLDRLMPDLNFGDSGEGSSYGFAPLEIATPYLIDNSPPGSYDFTLLRGGSDKVAVPSPCDGKIVDSGSWGGYGNALDLSCSDGAKMRFAHFSSLSVATGDSVVKGQPLGDQGSTGNSTGPHVHLELTLPGYAMSDRSVTLPYIEDVLFPFWKAGMVAQAHPSGQFGGGASSKAVDLIANFEGFHATPYWDVSQWTWGYGTKAPCAGEGCATITREDAKREQISYLERSCRPSIAPLGLNENQQAALYSLCYNLGTDQFTGSDVYKAIQSGDWASAAAAFDLYVNADGERLPGLVNRRAKEKQLFLSK